MNRKQALKTIAATTFGSVGLPQFAKSMNALPDDLKGNISHSVCRGRRKRRKAEAVRPLCLSLRRARQPGPCPRDDLASGYGLSPLIAKFNCARPRRTSSDNYRAMRSLSPMALTVGSLPRDALAGRYSGITSG